MFRVTVSADPRFYPYTYHTSTDTLAQARDSVAAMKGTGVARITDPRGNTIWTGNAGTAA